MCATSFSGPAPDELADPREPVLLVSLDDVEDRRALLAEAMRLADTINGNDNPPQPPPLGAHPDFDRRLADDAINNEPLYLLMAGAEAIRSNAPYALSLSGGELAQRAAVRERARLDHLAGAWCMPPSEVAHFMACITLQNGCSTEEACRLIEEERVAMDFAHSVPVMDTVRRLVEVWSASDGDGIDAIRPDLIGEAFILQVLEGDGLFPEVPSGIVVRARNRAGVRLVATLVRIAQDYARGDDGHPSKVLLGHLGLSQGSLSAAEQAVMLYNPHASFADSTISVTVEGLEIGYGKPRLADAEEAVSLHRELALRRPEWSRPVLAGSLYNFGVALRDAARFDQALTAFEEAVKLYRELALQRPDRFRPNLADSLVNFSATLRDAGRPEPAVVAAKDVVALYRKLALQRPDRFRPDLAMSLANLAATERVNDFDPAFGLI